MTKKIDKFQRLHALPVSTAVLDATGRIVAVNEAWKAFGERNGLCVPDFGVGENYFDFCSPAEVGDNIANQLRDLLDGRTEMITTIYPCHSPTQQRWFFLIGIPLSIDRPSGAAIVHAELTSLLPLPSSLSQVSALKSSSSSGDAILGAIEQSVTNTLATQLQAMIEEPAGEKHRADKDPSSKLSKKQLEVLRLLGDGKSNAEIAKALFRSPHTIKLHVSAILRQLNLKSRTQAALIASKLPKAR
ncbi:LuxR C-terminal-related transcriptional regulator [uncultured Hyphomicrobium sp.]|jgi:DNA-binding CsgD family transcriptional regulator|uniref:LuxR C-terminal-related transcriptional regulator n=1 Tax=uncultured Hyphomicrobium sp. TaxID=194373 RepID=UPI0025FA99E9|nr:LuxR C-terminal-related transcriptional regulator [uncultured Hyphomicrobium sp.]